MDPSSFPDYLQQYIPNEGKDHRAINRVKQAEERLVEHHIDVQKLKTSVFESRRVLSHGDLSEENLFQNQILIDWDYSGLYPMGLEVSVIYIRLKRNQIKTGTLGQWLKTNYKDTILKEDWKNFKRNVFYFLYIYNFPKYAEWEFFEELEQEIFQELKKNYFTKSPQ